MTPTPLSKYRQRITQRTELVNRRALLTLTLVAVTLLWILKPTDNLLANLLEQSDDPTVAIAFIRVLKTDESSPKLDLALARQHHKINRSEQGLAFLLPLDKYEDTPQWLPAHQLYALLLLSLSSENASAKSDLLVYLQNVPKALPEQQKLLLADYALQLGEPALAFYIRRDLPMQSANELLALSLQANLLTEAATQATALYQQAPKQSTLLQLLPILEQNQQGILALHLAQQHVQTATCDANCLQYLIGLALRQNNVASAAAFSHLKAEPSDQIADWLQASELFEAVGDLAQATHYLQRVTTRQPSLTHLKKLHQYARWQQHTEQALELSRVITKQDISQTTLQMALEDAMAESDLTAIADFHFQLAKHYRRTLPQLDEWVDANDKAYGATDTQQKLQQLLNLQAHQQHQGLRAHLARFFLFTGQPEQVIKLWPAYAMASPHTPEGLDIFVQAFISLGQPEAALEVLAQHASLKDLSSAMLSNMLDLATYTANLPLQRLYQQELVLRSDNELDVFLAIETHLEANPENQTFLWLLYQQTKSVNILAALLNQAILTKDNVLFTQVAETLQREHSQNNDLAVQQLRVTIALQQQNYPMAKQLLLSLLTQYPDNPNELLNAGWLALTLNDTPWLYRLYPALLKLPRSGAAQLRLLAAISERLGNLQHALHWQQRLALQMDVTAADKLNHALLAERLGYLDLAQQLRWQVVSQLSTQLRQEENGELSYQSLMNSLVAPAAATATLIEQQYQQPSSARLNLLAASTFSQNMAAIQFWQMQLAQQGHRINDSLSLTLALARRDKLAIRALATGSVTLSPIERANALAEIGDNAQAWALAESANMPHLSPIERASLQRLATRLHPIRSHGWRIETKEHSSWDYQSLNLRYYQPVADSHLQFTLQHEDGLLSTPLLDNFERQMAEFRWLTAFKDNDYQLTLATQLRQGITKQHLGQLLELNWQSSPRIGHNLALRYRMPTEQSRNLYLLGYENRLAWQPQWQATRYQSLSATLAYSQFATDFNEQIGRQWQLQMQFSEQVSRSPNWRWYGLINWQRNDLTTGAFTQLSTLTGNNFTAIDFLVPRYQRVALGQQLMRGQVGEPGPQQPHYRYWFDTSVGYNLITDNLDYTLNIGLGVRIFGQDELFFKSSWQSADPQGRESLSFNLGYYFDF